MKIKILFLLFLTLPLSANTGNDSVKRLFMKDAVQTYTGLKEIECMFIQTVSTPFLKEKILREGSFCYQAEGEISLVFDNGDYIKIDSEFLRKADNGKEEKLRIRSIPGLGRIHKLLSECLTGNLSDASWNRKNIEYDSDESEYTIILRTSDNGGKGIQEISMQFAKDDMTLRSLMIRKSESDYILYTFSNIQLKYQTL